jgi:hypothetical protein
MLLYRGLWYRHYYSKLAKDVNTEIRVGSWKNYSAFFDYLLGNSLVVVQFLTSRCQETRFLESSCSVVVGYD